MFRVPALAPCERPVTVIIRKINYGPIRFLAVEDIADKLHCECQGLKRIVAANVMNAVVEPIELDAAQRILRLNDGCKYSDRDVHGFTRRAQYDKFGAGNWVSHQALVESAQHVSGRQIVVKYGMSTLRCAGAVCIFKIVSF